MLDSRPYRILQFSMDGHLERSFGRVGRGPGELRAPISIGTKDDTLWVADPQGQGLQLFDRSGEVARSIGFRIEPDSLGEAAYPIGILASGRVIAGPRGASVTGVNSGWVDHQTLYMADVVGRLLDTLQRLHLPTEDFYRVELGNGQVAEGGNPVMEKPLHACLPRWARRGRGREVAG